MTVALYAEFESLPGEHTQVARLISDFAELVTHEDGNLQFEVHAVAESLGRFFVYERYRDEAAFESHLASSHGAEFNRRLGPLIVGGASQLTMLAPVRLGELDGLGGAR